MRKTILLTVMVACMITNSVYSQECHKILEAGVYQLMNVPKGRDLNADLKSYLTKPEFISEMRKGKWGETLKVPTTEGSFTITKHSPDTDFKKFQNAIASNPTLELSEAGLITIIQSVPNGALFSSFDECKKNTEKDKLKGNKVEYLESTMFVYYYAKSDPSDPLPKIKSVEFSSGTTIIDNDIMENNQKMPASVFTITCKRKPADDINVIVKSNKGDVYSTTGPNRSNNLETPVGTIISSYLSFDRFREINGETGVWRTTDKWAPCDGRDIYGSVMSYLGIGKAPDLRGYFLRGMTVFDPAPPPSVSTISPGERDPSINRSVGHLQLDSFEKHTHITKIPKGPGRFGSVNDDGDFGLFHGNFLETLSSESGGPETRPKNIAVFYYIKIN